MKKIVFGVVIVLGLYMLLHRRMMTQGLSVPTAFPTSLYNPALTIT